jgi:hypothetical protein
VRYAARDGGADGQVRDIELDRERVVLRRAVAGIPMKIGVPVRAFTGITMRTLPPDGDEPAAVAVLLEHRDNGLTVPLFVAIEGDDAMAQWKSWGRVLGLPLLVAESDGALREPFRRIGGVGVGASAPRRRRRAAIKWRRPSILMGIDGVVVDHPRNRSGVEQQRRKFQRRAGRGPAHERAP